MAYAYTKAARTRTLQENLKHGVYLVNHALETNYSNCQALEEIQGIWASQITDVNRPNQQFLGTYDQQNIVQNTNQNIHDNPTGKSSKLKKQTSYQQPVSQPPTPLEPLTAPPVPSSSFKPKPPPKTQKRTISPTFSHNDNSSESRIPPVGSYEILQPLQVAPTRSNAPKPPPRNRNSTASVASTIEATLQAGPKKPPAGAFNYMMAGQLPSKPMPPPRDGQAKETHF